MAAQKKSLDDELESIGKKKREKTSSPKKNLTTQAFRDLNDEIDILCGHVQDGQLVLGSPSQEWLEWWRGPVETAYASRRGHLLCHDSDDLALRILYAYEMNPPRVRLADNLITIGDEKKCKTFPFTSLISANNRDEVDDKQRREEKRPRVPEGLGFAPSLEV